MTEWDAADYERISGLQVAMADKVLAVLDLSGASRVLDVGCGNGKITAEIAARRPEATVVGVDPSHEMIGFAASHYGTATHPNLRFEVADARQLPYRAEFDLVVSFNALHWVRAQEQALQSIHDAMQPGGRAQLRLVGKGARHSLEHVLEGTCFLPQWAGYFEGFEQPYLHLTPEQYGDLAKRCGFAVAGLESEDEAWDFQTRAAFEAFGDVTFVEWTRRLPEEKEAKFIEDVLDRYRQEACEKPGEGNVFKFYQMNVELRRS
jgi:trans-aconitate 2-methyltransferase